MGRTKYLFCQNHEGNEFDQIDGLSGGEVKPSPPGLLSGGRKGLAMKKGLIIISIILMGFAVLGMIEASQLERTMKMGIGISFLPFWMSAFIGILSLTLLISVLRGKISEPDTPLFPRENIPRVAIVTTALLGYIIFLETIGYIISTFLFFLVTIFILQRKRIVSIVFFGALFTFILVAIFKMWLKSPLPPGLFGI